MSGKLINKKLKGTKQQPPDEPREPLVRELFPNTTPKSDKKKNKKKTGVGKSSESVKGLGGLGEDSTLDSEIESVDSVSLSEDQDESKSEQSESDNKAKGPKGVVGAGKNQLQGSAESPSSIHVLSTTTFKPVRSLTTHTVTAIEQYVWTESNGVAM